MRRFLFDQHVLTDDALHRKSHARVKASKNLYVLMAVNIIPFRQNSVDGRQHHPVILCRLDADTLAVGCSVIPTPAS